MQARTWLQKLTDESNLWFNAVKAEDDGDYVTAASFYLKDAIDSATNKALVRQALSISCAANCLFQIGAVESRQLYSAAARLYMKNADKVISGSIREALWSIEEAYENLISANDYVGARELRAQYLSLAARKSPFSTTPEAIRDLDELERSGRKTIPSINGRGIPPKILEEIQKAIKLVNVEEIAPAFSRASFARSIVLDGGSGLNEKGIVS